MLEGHDSAIAGLEGASQAINAFLGFGDLVTLGAGGSSMGRTRPSLIHQDAEALTARTARETNETRPRAVNPTAVNEHGLPITGAAKAHRTEAHWTKNASGPRSLEDAINFADDRGSFGQGFIDYEVLESNVILVDHGEFKIKYRLVEDSTFDEVFGADKFASYSVKSSAKEVIIDKRLSWNDMFGGTAAVNVRSSVFESDRAITVVLGHEYFEISGLHKRAATTAIYRSETQAYIDYLHNYAVDYADNLVQKMINEGR
ncbi:hypothetical protein SAMN04487939_1011025 [Lysobacter sp. yr284]|uniref:hypothetical protein n=1 Tax=Lysobacter sp. yr284 TaxID=1761791 RepID=UPI0008954FC4|nr:hypothetical protein [Lysobacter sp. yr284]SDY36092.1 hypothetical protein SAMN04487939_1011025 [Lysobacter sp. yr284]